jgi:hypothetical protein
MSSASLESSAGWAARALLAARVLGAVGVLAVGGVHLHEYRGLYSAIPTIGTLFLLNFVAATLIGVGLLAPVEHLLGRWGSAVVALFATAGAGLAATSFVILYISERRPVFGFMEPGYDPSGIRFSQESEIATVLILGAFLVARYMLALPARRW